MRKNYVNNDEMSPYGDRMKEIKGNYENNIRSSLPSIS